MTDAKNSNAFDARHVSLLWATVEDADELARLRSVAVRTSRALRSC